MLRRLHSSTETWLAEDVRWSGESFSDPDTQSLWSKLPSSLKSIARAEFDAGNAPTLIQKDMTTGVVLLEFPRGPLVSHGHDPDVIVHTQHEYGNYCYDGTKFTFESKARRSFLAFQDPEWKDGAV